VVSGRRDTTELTNAIKMSKPPAVRYHKTQVLLSMPVLVMSRILREV
jgi:hypothetical protein